MAVNQMWTYGGEAAVQDKEVECPGDTSIQAGGHDITKLFCDGTVFPFEFLW